MEGIFQLADVCQERLDERDDAFQYENLKASLSLVRLFANDALKSGNLAEGFRLTAECFARQPLFHKKYCRRKKPSAHR